MESTSEQDDRPTAAASSVTREPWKFLFNVDTQFNSTLVVRRSTTSGPLQLQNRIEEPPANIPTNHLQLLLLMPPSTSFSSSIHYDRNLGNKILIS